MTYTQVLHDGKNQSNCHTLKNKRKIVQQPPPHQDSKDMQGWLAWDSYPVCTCTTETVPVLLRQRRLWSITKGTRLCPPPVAVRLGACSQPAVCLAVSSPARNTVPCTFPRAHFRLCTQVPSWHQRGAEVRGEQPAHWEETLQRKQKAHCVFCMRPGIKRRLSTFPYSLCGIHTKLMELCPAFTFASLHPLSRSSPCTEDIAAYSWNRPAQELKSK